MEQITINAEFLFELSSKQEWINRVPRILPSKKRHSNELWIWFDVNGNCFEIGKDFSAAEEMSSYPCKVYRVVTVAEALGNLKTKNQKMI